MKKNNFLATVARNILLSTLLISGGITKDSTATLDAEDSREFNGNAKEDDFKYIKLFDNGVAYFDLIATTKICGWVEINGKPPSQVRPIPSTVQKEEFYKQLLSLFEINADDANIPQFVAKPNEESERIRLYYGITENEKTQQILDGVQVNEYGYCVEGKDIFIYGHNMDELKKASDAFVNELIMNKVEDDGAKIFRLPVDLNKTLAGDELAIMSVPKPDFGGKKFFCESGPAGERLWVVKDCTAEDYGNYINALKSASFVEYETNEIEGNLYATYTKDSIIVDAWYTKNGYIRITASEGYDSRPLTADPYTEKGKGPALFMLGKAVDNGGGHECLAFRLSDGRFVMVDSGHPWEYGDNLMAFLKKEADDPDNIVVANWIFTHNHGDHVCGFEGLCHRIEQYKDILTVESFTYNFPADEQANTPFTNAGTSKIPGFAKSLFPNAKIYKALPGNTFKFADMKYEILASHESYMYDVCPSTTNSLNVFYRVSMGGQIINVPGDTCDWSHQELLQLYKDCLQCDILQAPHHGGLGASTVESSKTYKPKYILFCHSNGVGRNYGWENVKDEEYNHYLIDPDKNPNYREHFIMSEYVWYFPLPYTTGSAVRYAWSDYGM